MHTDRRPASPSPRPVVDVEHSLQYAKSPRQIHVDEAIVRHLKPMTIGEHFKAYSLRAAGKSLGPFLGVDHVWMSAPTFPLHAHEGICAISYVFADSQSGIQNRDSLGARNVIRPGGLHWMTAGSGVMHEEVPAELGKTVHSLQIFVDLDIAMRELAPSTISLEPDEIPVVRLPGAEVRVPLGEFLGHCSSVITPTQVLLLDISLDDGAAIDIPVPEGHRAFVLPIIGTVSVDGQAFERDDFKSPSFSSSHHKQSVSVAAVGGKAKVVLFSGKPLHAERD